jgi:hypothetical protein
LLKIDYDNEDKLQENALSYPNQLVKFLDDLKLNDLHDLFIKKDISPESLLTFNDNDLIKV